MARWETESRANDAGRKGSARCPDSASGIDGRAFLPFLLPITKVALMAVDVSVGPMVFLFSAADVVVRERP